MIRPASLAPVKLDHLRKLTDGVGLLQHAKYRAGNPAEGYCTDDNARALLLSVRLDRAAGPGSPDPGDLTDRYLRFLIEAFNEDAGRFRNFRAYDGRWLEATGSEDSHGRALWALGTAAAASDRGTAERAARLFDRALGVLHAFAAPRAWAFAILGIEPYLRSPKRAIGPALEASDALVDRLVRLYSEEHAADWRWFEPIVTYDNARIPHALLASAVRTQRREIEAVALESLEWLASVQTSVGGFFAPIGNEGFFPRGGARAQFDQQPIDANANVEASLAAYRLTGDDRWADEARRSFEWFMGRNELGLSLYDETTGGCRDGLMAEGVNQNEGAESTLAYLLSAAELREPATMLYPGDSPIQQVRV